MTFAFEKSGEKTVDKSGKTCIIVFVRQDTAGLCKGSTADSDSVCEGSNPSPAASKRSETNGFQTSFLVSDPLFDPLTVLGLSIESAPHIGFHAVCAVLFHFFRDMAIYVVPRSLLGTARKAAPPNGGAALRQLVKKVRTDFFDKLRQNRKIKNSILFCDFGRCGG